MTHTPITGNACDHPLGYEDWSDGTKRCTFCRGTQPITGEELEAMKSRARQVTSTEWRYVKRKGEMEEFVQVGGMTDAFFIAHARTDLPRCIAEIERLRLALQGIASEPDDLCNAHSEGSLCGGAELAREALSPEQKGRIPNGEPRAPIPEYGWKQMGFGGNPLST